MQEAVKAQSKKEHAKHFVFGLFIFIDLSERYLILST